MRNKRWLFLLLAAFLLIGGCGISNVEKGEREAVEYTVLRASFQNYNLHFSALPSTF